ncbi:unnamed protein product, partial [Symbiodinium sp. KB8]
VMDAAKCADVVLCVLGPHASLEEPAFDDLGYKTLTALKAQGLPLVFGAIHGSDTTMATTTRKQNEDGTVTQAETSAAAFKSKITQWLLAKGSETRVGRVSIESDAGASNSEAMVCVQVQGRPASEQSFQAMRSGYVELPGGEQVIRGSGILNMRSAFMCKFQDRAETLLFEFCGHQLPWDLKVQVTQRAALEPACAIETWEEPADDEAGDSLEATVAKFWEIFDIGVLYQNAFEMIDAWSHETPSFSALLAILEDK